MKRWWIRERFRGPVVKSSIFMHVQVVCHDLGFHRGFKWLIQRVFFGETLRRGRETVQDCNNPLFLSPNGDGLRETIGGISRTAVDLLGPKRVLGSYEFRRPRYSKNTGSRNPSVMLRILGAAGSWARSPNWPWLINVPNTTFIS